MTRNQLTSLSLAFLFFFLAISYDYYTDRQTSLARYENVIEDYLHKQERRVEDIMEDRDFIYRITGADSESLSKRSEDLERLQQLSGEDFTIYITKNDKIIFWNNNLSTLPAEAYGYDNGERTSQFISHSNGYYQLTSQTSIDEKLGQYNIHAMIPIRYNYQLVSNYIKDQFVADDQIPSMVELSTDFTDYEINNKSGQQLTYLDAPDDLVDVRYQRLLCFLIFSGLFMLGVFIHLTTIKIIDTHKPWMGAAFMIGTVLSLRFISILSGFTDRFSALPFFHKIFDSLWTNSLGDMFIDVSLLLWLMVFFHQAYPMQRNKVISKNKRFALASMSYFSIVLSFLSLTAVFKMIVFNSRLNYDFNNVFNLDIKSIIAIVAVVILLTALFVFCHRMILIVKKMEIPIQHRLVAIGLANLMAFPFFFTFDFIINWGILLSISFILIIFFDLFVERPKVDLLFFIFLLGILAFFPSVLLFMYNSYLDNTIRSEYARKLSELQDPYAEHSIKNLVDFVKEDKIIAQQIDSIVFPFNVFPFKKQSEKIENQLNIFLTSDNYLFYNYRYNLNIFSKDKTPTLAEAKESYNVFQDKLKKATKVKGGHSESDLYFYENSDEQNWSYLLEVPVSGSRLGSDEYTMVLEFVRSHREQSKVYTELLIDQPYKKLPRLNKYDFAVYHNNKQLDSKGNIYGSELTLDNLPGPDKHIKQTIGSRTEIIYQSADEKTVVIIGRDRDTLIKMISLFSYMLTLMITIVFVAMGLNTIFKFVPHTFNFYLLRSPSLKNKIQLAVVALTVFSFLFIGFTTTWFFKNSSEEYHEKRLERKASSVLTDAQREIERMNVTKESLNNDIKSILKPVSETHRIDINLYNLNGELIGSSEEDLYRKEVISRQMGSVAFQALSEHKRSHYTQDGEHIGSLKYKAAYVSLLGPDEKPVAYMGLPYYSKQSKMSNDVTLFLSTLINVYVFLLFIAGGIAMWTARSITKHITKIGEKLKETKLGKNNTPLEWESDDEIGALIKEYNKMIRQLDSSVQKLAQSEREGAWREMAKQVAHEIKNPLTPMKLSIQYLQHAFQSRPDNIEPLLKRVSATLIEQIDNLSHIATEFSNFAKMPQAENQKIILNNHVTSVYNLFRSENVDLRLSVPKETFIVFADKNHLVRVFNNLIKNAIQAIPEGRNGVITVSLYKQDEEVAIVCVHDNGSGISNDKKDKVFVPNFTTKNSGTGLGLAISKNIIESVNGRIWFETEINVGTKFFVELPIVEIKEPEYAG